MPADVRSWIGTGRVWFGLTNRWIWKDGASTAEESWRQLEAWAASPSNRLIGETNDFPATLGPFIQRPRVHGGVVHDARIAAICLAHGVEVLLSRDRDLMLFQELRLREPFRKNEALLA